MTLTGSYRRKRGLCQEYEYAASWRMEREHLVWSATVWVMEEGTKGFPGGLVFVGPGAADPAVLVRELVESSIENLVGVEE